MQLVSDTNKVYNQENVPSYKLPTNCTTSKMYQDTNKVYNQKKVPRYQQSVHQENVALYQQSVQLGKHTNCWCLSLLS